jgi:hydrogenase maturation protease
VVHPLNTQQPGGAEVQPHILLMGVGNLLLQDEGLGVRALECLLAGYQLPGEVQAVDGGTMGLDLLPYLQGATDTLIIDAVETGKPAGTLARLEGDEITSALSMKVSIHQIGLQEVLAVSRLHDSAPKRLVIWGMQPDTFGWGTDLSPAVAANLACLAEAVVEELRSWGVNVRRQGN